MLYSIVIRHSTQEGGRYLAQYVGIFNEPLRHPQTGVPLQSMVANEGGFAIEALGIGESIPEIACILEVRFGIEEIDPTTPFECGNFPLGKPVALFKCTGLERLDSAESVMSVKNGIEELVGNPNINVPAVIATCQRSAAAKGLSVDECAIFLFLTGASRPAEHSLH